MIWHYVLAIAFALFGYVCGFLHGRRSGHRIGYQTGRKAGTFWERWRRNDDR